MTGRLTRIRSAITGRFVTTNEADAAPETTVMETIGNAIELRVAAEAVILGRGFPDDGRVEVNEADLDRLREAVGFISGQP